MRSYVIHTITIIQTYSNYACYVFLRCRAFSASDVRTNSCPKMELKCIMLPEVLTASSQNDPVSRKALVLHQKRDVAVFLVGHQRRQLLRQKVHVVDLSRRGERAQRVTVAHGCHLHLHKT